MTELTLRTNQEYYLNARDHWARHKLDYWSKPDSQQLTEFNTNRYQEEVVKPFHAWLKEQGCCIIRPNASYKMFGVDSYDVAVGFDLLEFDSQQELTVFTLRWAGSREY